jgi:hypothetical protein
MSHVRAVLGSVCLLVLTGCGAHPTNPAASTTPATRSTTVPTTSSSALPVKTTTPVATFTPVAVSPSRTGNDGQAVYVATGPGDVEMIRWTQTGHSLSGTFDESTGTAAPASGERALYGTRQGNDITLTVGTVQWTGTITGKVLAVHYPKTDGSIGTGHFLAGSIDDYNADIANLQGQAAAAAAAASSAAYTSQLLAAVAKADNALNGDLDDLDGLAQSLQGDATLAEALAAFPNDLMTMRADLSITKAEKDCNTKQGDANTVQGDANTIQGDMNTLGGDINTIDGDVGEVTAERATVVADAATLKSALRSAPGNPPLSTSDAQVTGVLGDADRELKSAAVVIADGRAKAKAFQATSTTINAQAQALAAACTG